MRTTLITIAGAVLTVCAACGGGEPQGSERGTAKLPQGSRPFEVDPADFTTEIDHPYWPMKPGNRWIYRETDAEGAVSRVVVTVTNRTKSIIGIEARVVHDQVTEDGEVKED